MASRAVAAAMAIPGTVFITKMFWAISIDTTPSFNTLIYASSIGCLCFSTILYFCFLPLTGTLESFSSRISLDIVVCVTLNPASFSRLANSSCVSISNFSINSTIFSCLFFFISYDPYPNHLIFSVHLFILFYFYLNFIFWGQDNASPIKSMGTNRSNNNQFSSGIHNRPSC